MMAAATRLAAAASEVAQSFPSPDQATPAQNTPTKTPGPTHVGPVAGNALGAFDPGQAVVDQMQALAAFKANVAVFESADRMMKSLIEIKA
jgi:flagellar hook protein FlgE